MAHVPQGRGTFPELTVEENLRVGGLTRPTDDVTADMERWFEVFPRLKERIHQAAGSMSGGEQQMLAIARALMSRPTLLLLDEPSLGLAPLVTRDVFERIALINTELGTTVLVVEQNANLALDIAAPGVRAGDRRHRGVRHRRRAPVQRRGAPRLPGGLTDVQLFIQRVFDGLQAGAIYAILALAIVIIFRASGMLNFAQGEIAMFTTFVAWNLFDSGLPWWAASVASLLIGFIVGAVLYRLLIVRLGGTHANPLAVVMVTIGLFLMLNDGAGVDLGHRREARASACSATAASSCSAPASPCRCSASSRCSGCW